MPIGGIFPRDFYSRTAAPAPAAAAPSAGCVVCAARYSRYGPDGERKMIDRLTETRDLNAFDTALDGMCERHLDMLGERYGLTPPGCTGRSVDDGR